MSNSEVNNGGIAKTPNAIINIDFESQPFKESNYLNMLRIIQEYVIEGKQSNVIVFCSTKVFNSIFSFIGYNGNSKIQFEVDDSLIGGNDFQYSELKAYVNDKFIINYKKILEV